MFPSSEIYGGINGFWDYGPLGAELKQNLKAAWWQRIVRGRDDVEGIDSSIIAHPRTWEASGHVEHFSDPLVDCRACKRRFRADQLEDELAAANERLDAARAKLAEQQEKDVEDERQVAELEAEVEELRAKAGLPPKSAAPAPKEKKGCGNMFFGILTLMGLGLMIVGWFTRGSAADTRGELRVFSGAAMTL